MEDEQKRILPVIETLYTFRGCNKGNLVNLVMAPELTRNVGCVLHLGKGAVQM